MRQQRKVNCWYWRDGSWTLVEDLCLCLLVKLSVEDNSSGHVNEGCHNYWIETCGKWRSPEFHQNQAGSSHLMNSKCQKNCGSHLA